MYMLVIFITFLFTNYAYASLNKENLVKFINSQLQPYSKDYLPITVNNIEEQTNNLYIKNIHYKFNYGELWVNCAFKNVTSVESLSYAPFIFATAKFKAFSNFDTVKFYNSLTHNYKLSQENLTELNKFKNSPNFLTISSKPKTPLSFLSIIAMNYLDQDALIKELNLKVLAN